MADPNFLAFMQGNGAGFNPYAAGNKQYPGGSPNNGPVSAEGQAGYQDRDTRARMLRNAALRRLQAGQQGNYMNPDYLKGQV